MAWRLGERQITRRYEGNLMAEAGVSYVVGREGKDVYGEEHAGFKTEGLQGWPAYRQTISITSTLVLRSRRPSPALPKLRISSKGGRSSGAGVQLSDVTDAPSNRVDWEKPKGYNKADYEALGRYIEASTSRVIQALRRSAPALQHRISWLTFTCAYPTEDGYQ